MRMIVAVLGVALAAGTVVADEADLINAATLNALEKAQASLEASPKLGDLKRIGVATFEGDPSNVTALVKSMATKTALDVVLTSDVDWGPLLDEFARQIRRGDIIKPETAHELRVQGVDAVMFGTVEKADVESIEEGGQVGQRATVRVLLSLASVAEQNPGSLVWSEQVIGMAEALELLPAETRIVTFATEYRLILIAVAAVVVVLLLALLFRRATAPR